MILTNKKELPDYIEAWLKQDDGRHSDNHLSATKLLKPVRAVVLGERHDSEVEYDIENMIDSQDGEDWHTSVARAVKKVLPDEFIVEEPIEAEYDVDGITVVLKGIPDLVRRPKDGSKLHKIIDLKKTKTYGVQKGDKELEWSQQLSIYRSLLSKQSTPILCEDDAEISAQLKNWSPSDAKRYKGYPPHKLHVIRNLPLLSVEKAEEFIVGRLRLILAARKLPDDQLPHCTAEDLWPHPKTGQFNRCYRYCSVKQKCNQYQAMLEKGLVAIY